MKLKQICRSNWYPKNFVDLNKKMYLYKVFESARLFVFCQKRN